MEAVFAVGTGAFLGGCLRLFLSRLGKGGPRTLPYGTACANMLGTVLLGLYGGAHSLGYFTSAGYGLFFSTGFCGGLTTLSTFLFEVLGHHNRRETELAVLYCVGSLILGFVLYIAAYYGIVACLR